MMFSLGHEYTKGFRRICHFMLSEHLDFEWTLWIFVVFSLELDTSAGAVEGTFFGLHCWKSLAYSIGAG